MNISQLRAFAAVVDRGSFSGAAKELGISQPAVTMQVQSLEAEIGATLLDRGYRRIDLTEAGSALLPHAREVLEQLDAAEAEIRSLSETVSGRLVIAASTTPASYVVPRILGAFSGRYPRVGLSLTVGDTDEVIRAVESGDANVGISGDMMQGARVEFEQVGHDELVLIAAPSHAAANKKHLRIRDLCDESWVLREQGSGTRRVAERIVAEQGLEPAELRVALELSTGEAIVSAVEGALGVAIVSKFVAEKAIALKTIVQLDVEGLPAMRPFFLVLPKGTPTRAAQAFAEHFAESQG